MKNVWMLTSAAMVIAGSVAVIAVVNTASAQQPAVIGDRTADAPATPKSIRGLNSEQVNALTQYATPGSAHEQLVRKFSGMWAADYKLWFNPNEKEPYSGQSNVEYKSIFGGRYLQGNCSAAIPMTVEHQSVIGYDNVKKEYFLSGICSMSTGIHNLPGKFDAEANTYTFEGNAVNQIEREPSQPYKVEFKCVNENRIQQTIWQDGNKFYEATLIRNMIVNNNTKGGTR